MFRSKKLILFIALLCLLIFIVCLPLIMAVQLQRIFVYGTLKRGQPNHYVLENASNGLVKFINNATTVKRYPLVIASRFNIPFILPYEGKGHSISGEIYDVDETMLTLLDKFEQHPNVYKREEISVNFDNTTSMSWCYILQRPKSKLLDLKFLETYDNNKYVAEEKYIGRTKSSEDRQYHLEVMEST